MKHPPWHLSFHALVFVSLTPSLAWAAGVTQAQVISIVTAVVGAPCALALISLTVRSYMRVKQVEEVSQHALERYAVRTRRASIILAALPLMAIFLELIRGFSISNLLWAVLLSIPFVGLGAFSFHMAKQLQPDERNES